MKLKVILLFNFFLLFSATVYPEDWKGWKEWKWDRPAFEVVLPTEGESPIGFILEFKSTWNPIFAHYPNAADGFLVFHVASPANEENVKITIRVSNAVIIEADSAEYIIPNLHGGEVSSYFVPIKLMNETGEFLVESFLDAPKTFVHTSASIYIIREHRREIYALAPWDFVERQLKKMLEGAYKRPGAEYYSPYYLSLEGSSYPDDKNFIIVDEPSWVGINFQTLDIQPILNKEIKNDFEIEESEISEEDASAAYTFRGTIIYRGPYSYRLCFLNSCRNSYAYVLKGATVKVFDKDTWWDDFICETITNEYGYFECSGRAYDPGWWNKPDPYIVIYSGNNRVSIKDCSGNLYQYKTGVYSNHDSGIIDVDGWYVAQDPSNPWTRALWTFSYALPVWARNKQIWGGDIGSYDIRIPCGCWPSYCPKGYSCPRSNPCSGNMIGGTIEITSDFTSSPSVIAHEFGHALMDYFYNYSNWPQGGGTHYLCRIYAPGLTWKEGFATANSLFVFNTTHSCNYGLPWGPTSSGDGACSGGFDFEGSTLHRNYDNLQNRWIKHFCGEILDSSNQPADQRNEAYVASVLLDVFDYTNNIDMDCDFHHSQGRNACDQIPDPYYDSNYAWWRILQALTAKPQNFFEFANALIPKGNTVNECLERDAIRATARFNGIALEGLFGVTGYEGCCAVSQAALSAAKNNIIVDGKSVTSEEEEKIKNNLRLFRDRVLSQYPKGKEYINIYYNNSDEIAKIITTDLDLLISSIRIIRYASERYEKLDTLIKSNTPVLDSEIQNEIKYLLMGLKMRGSPQLIETIKNIEADFENVRDMTATEIIEYLGGK